MLATRPAHQLTTDADAERVRQIGEAANAVATAHAFSDYNARKADNTLIAKRADLSLFAAYLAEVGIERDPAQLQTDADAWRGVTWGIVAAFAPWMLGRGMAQSSVGRALSTVKVYARLAHQSGAIGGDDWLRIRSVQGYSGAEAKRVDARRAEAGQPTRKGNKKAEPVALTDAQAKALKRHPDTAQGRRDALLMALLIDHGLRESELERVTLGAVDLEAKRFTFYRPKVDLEQTHEMSRATARAFAAWIGNGHARAMGAILRGSRKGGELTDDAMSLSAIRQRVRALGRAGGVDNLSPHDCRHYWATVMADKVERGLISLFRLQEAGGWTSLEMPRRYVARAAIANKGMHTDEGDD